MVQDHLKNKDNVQKASHLLLFKLWKLTYNREYEPLCHGLWTRWYMVITQRGNSHNKLYTQYSSAYTVPPLPFASKSGTHITAQKKRLQKMRTTSIAHAVCPGSFEINSCLSISLHQVHLSTDASEIKEHHKDDTVVHVSSVECARKR